MDKEAFWTINYDAFNESQQTALLQLSTLKSGFMLVQGPPGTGKSHLIAHGIIPLLCSAPRHETVLVCCNSNIAVDQLLMKLVDTKLLPKTSVARVGHEASVSTDVKNLGLFCETGTPRVLNAKVIFTTVHKASQNRDPGTWPSIDCIIFDEAAQLSQSATLLTLARSPGCLRVVLVGDHKQIRPYVDDSLLDRGYGVSLMERIVNCSGAEKNNAGQTSPSSASPDATSKGVVAFTMLRHQYRMPPSVCDVVSSLFYRGLLLNGNGLPSAQPKQEIFQRLPPICVLDIEFGERIFDSSHQSYCNPAEAEAVRVVYEWVQKRGGVAPEQMCVISPWVAHTMALRMSIGKISKDRANEYSNRRPNARPLPDENKMSNIDTVDKFQGSERDVVFLSPCATSVAGRSEDPNFLNVAVSRCRHVLFIVGKVEALAAGSTMWNTLLSTIGKQQSVQRVRIASLQELTPALERLWAANDAPPASNTTTATSGDAETRAQRATDNKGEALAILQRRRRERAAQDAALRVEQQGDDDERHELLLDEGYQVMLDEERGSAKRPREDAETVEVLKSEKQQHN